MTAPYPYGAPPTWWGCGPDAAAQAARDAIALSVRVGDRMRAIAGTASVVGMDAQVPSLFSDPAERTEAYRLLELAARNSRKKANNTDQTAMGLELPATDG